MEKRLKISCLGRVRPAQATTWVPHLRLTGKWLREAGFEIGNRVRVQREGKKLIIEVCDQ